MKQWFHKYKIYFLLFLFVFVLLNVCTFDKLNTSSYIIINNAIITSAIITIAYLIHTAKIFTKRKYLYMIMIVGAILLALSPVFQQDGWPLNHEKLSFNHRTQIYSENMLQYNILPLWSATDSYDLGTPLPLFYHKLFYYLSGSLFILTSSMKLTLCLTIGFFMFIGIIGCYKCFRLLKLETLPSVILSISFIFLNYSFTNWLVRGAMAEFSAFMLLPWILHWCIELIKKQNYSVRIGILLYLLYLAHNIIALFSTVIVLFSLVITILYNTKILTKKFFIKIIQSLLIFIILMSVYIIPLMLFLKYFSPVKITDLTFIPQYQIKPLETYLKDNYTWLNQWEGYTIQLDQILLFFLVFLGISFTIVWIFKIKRITQEGKRTQETMLVVGILLTTTIIFFFMQTKESLFLYDSISILNYIQFPWRLLTFISLFMLILVGILLSFFNKKTYIAPLISFIILTVLILSGPVTHLFEYNFYTSGIFEKKLDPNQANGLQDSIVGIGEYLPNTLLDNKPPTAEKRLIMVKHYNLDGFVYSGKCIIQPIPRKFAEQIYREYSLECDSNTTLIFPINYSSYERVYVDNIYTQAFRTNDDMRIHIDIKKGLHSIRIEFPTLINVLKKSIRSLF